MVFYFLGQFFLTVQQGEGERIDCDIEAASIMLVVLASSCLHKKITEAINPSKYLAGAKIVLCNYMVRTV